MRLMKIFIFFTSTLLVPNQILAHDIVATLENMSPTATAISYLNIGFEHILPLGFDHILFIISLVLFSPNLRQLFTQSAAFTAGHCITLALASFQIFNISPNIIEPIIALTIVYVAAENILKKELKASRLILIFAFGLLHGLGFASALSEIGLAKNQFILSLFMFNVGLELGQILIIILSFGVLMSIQKQFSITWPKLVFPVSIFIICIGMYWVIERLV